MNKLSLSNITSSFTTLLSLAITITTLAGCMADKGNGNDSDTSENLDLEISSSTNSKGLASMSFKTAKDVTKFTVTAQSTSNKSTRITSLSVSGSDYLSPGGANISLAQDFSPILVSTTVPSRETDKPLSSPQEVSVNAEIENANAQTGDQILFKVTSRKDGNLSSGSLNLNVFYVGSIGAEKTTKDAMKSALSVAKDIFSNQAGINLKIVEADIAGKVLLPLPSNGDKLYSSASQTAASPAVNVFIGGDIGATSSSGEILGIAANIPGPPTPTAKSAVAISIFTSAGSDGVFDSEDVRILGETIAHESGHFMGLFHPVDFAGNVVAASDPLSDTDSCSFNTQCVANTNLNTNLMFPNPVPDNRGNYIPQNRLTAEQKGVLNRYAAVD